jgi:serine/threonine protein kinase
VKRTLRPLERYKLSLLLTRVLVFVCLFIDLEYDALSSFSTRATTCFIHSLCVMLQTQAKEYIQSLKKYDGVDFRTIYPAADAAALDLLKKMLQFNPKKRCTADEALEHDFLKSIRRPELEITVGSKPIRADDIVSFLEAPNIDVSMLKQYTYAEVLHYRHRK